MRSWKEQLDGSWLGDASSVRDLDSWVRGRLASHRRLARAAQVDVVAAGVGALVEDVRSFGLDNRWFWASCAICLLAELVLAAEFGGTFGSRRRGREVISPIVVTPLVILRNALFHPAHQSAAAGAGRPHVEQLVEWLRENSEAPLAERLAASWSVIGSREVAEFALRRLNVAGTAFAKAMRLR